MTQLRALRLLVFVLATSECQAQQTPADMKKTTQNGMSVSWKTESDQVRIVMEAPTTGWLAIGFNTSDKLPGTNLLMACVRNGEATLSDRYIVAQGDHRPVGDLGGVPVARLLSGSENEHSTRIEFLLPLRATDRWYHTLRAGSTYTLLLAFSREDDFAHHSTMRSSVEITF